MWSVLGFQYHSFDEECAVDGPVWFFDEWTDLCSHSVLVAVLFALSKVVSGWIYAGYAREYAMRECGGNTADPKFEETEKKYREEAWKSKVTTLITLFGVFVMTSEEIAELDIWNFIKEYPQKSSPLIVLYYRIALGYHSFRTVNQFFEPRRKDFLPMMLHHWVTLFLIFISCVLGLTQVGVIVMLCHDNGDALLSWGKILTYSRWHRIRDVVLVTFIVMWVLTRIIGLTYCVIMPYLRATHFSCHPLFWIFLPPLLSLLVCVCFSCEKGGYLCGPLVGLCTGLACVLAAPNNFDRPSQDSSWPQRGRCAQ